MKSNLLKVKPACFLTAAILLAGCMTAQDYVKKGEESSKFEESVNYFNRALELEPDNIELRRSIAAKYIPEIKKNKGEKRADLFNKARALDPDNPDIYFANAYALYVRDKDYRAGANASEEILKKNPEFRVPSNVPSNESMFINGSTFGFKNTSQFSQNRLPLGNMSLLFFIGTAYYDVVSINGSKLSQAEKNNILDKSLQSLQRGYDLDIVQGKNNTEIAKTLYLLQMARTAELKGDYQLAIQNYTTFLNDSSIRLDKAGISDKRQPLYARAGQQAPAVAANTPPGQQRQPAPAAASNPPPSQQNRPAPIDLTGQREYGFGGEIGRVYRLRFSSTGLNKHEFAVDVPPYIRSVTVFTEGDLDTVIEWGGALTDLLELAGIFRKPTDMIIVDNQSATDRNARITFPSIPVNQGGSRKIGFTVTEKNGREGTYILVIQGNR